MESWVFTDQLGRKVQLAGAPQRIVSLVPSQTELLAYLGLDTRVVGITRFCIHPKQWYRCKKRVGGTKDVKVERVLALNPDLIIANKEENEAGVIEILSKFCPVWISDVKTLPDALDMIRALGELTQTSGRATALAQQIEIAFNEIPGLMHGKRVFYLIWYKPWMAAGTDTFIGHLLERLGAINLAAEFDGRYPQLSVDRMQEAKPDFILLSDEPFPFSEKHLQELRELGLQTEIRLINGDAFSWYGNRLLLSPAYFRSVFQ